ncbi:CD99 antigen-like protein 2 isoform X2 [Choloepus didactylus]|uniref:CD99 antigen-like protein 2 isoform X2 n=1 Tax=Choloepus didactylus TaxID=27675 RepID=UPI00189FDCA3|nr:CD99 antigen-like protein 2 isoform X2 [Choloepus didactylus]XP_037678296.1 CD99 antigen-like protein 2 isoform X2 [Choloepus didactylus]
MVAWRSASLVCLAFSLAALVQRGLGDFNDDFNLEDALRETSSVKQDSDVDFFDPQTTPRTYPKKTERWNRFTTTTTKRPGTTRAPANPADNDFNLADALDDRNDQDGGHRKPSAGGGGFSDKDLADIVGGGEYKPDRNKGDDGYGGGDNSGSGMSTETVTIASVASALTMALIGAISSYISYQQKKFCFRIQQGLNADYVKGENLEAVV